MNISFLDQLRSLLAAASLAVSDPRPRGKFLSLRTPKLRPMI
jgi:hypothetical protein